MVSRKKHYIIEMREFEIKLPLSSILPSVAHNFWVLYDDKGYIVNEIHGLATDRKTGKSKPIGLPTEQLKGWVYPTSKQNVMQPNNIGFSGLYRLDQLSRGYLIAPREEVLACWDKALNAVDKINALDINYWPILLGEGAGRGNSNSVARTLADAMGFKYSNIRLWDPGSEKNLLIQPYCVDEKESIQEETAVANRHSFWPIPAVQPQTLVKLRNSQNDHLDYSVGAESEISLLKSKL